jgi:hypothetical protein
MKLSYLKSGSSRHLLLKNATVTLEKPCDDGLEYEVWHAPIVDLSEAARMLDAGFPDDWVTGAMLRAIKGARGSTVRRYFVPAN